MTNKTIYQLLTYFGGLPFIFCTVLLQMGMKDISLFGNVENILATYTVIILAFMFGILWGLKSNINNLIDDSIIPINIFIVSGLATVITWLCYLLLSFDLFLIYSIGLYLFLLFLDSKLLQYSIISVQYFHLRRNITVIVVICLTINLLSKLSIQ